MHSVRALDVRVGGQRAHDEELTLDSNSAELVESPDVDHPPRWFAELAGDLHHQIGPAGYGTSTGEQGIGLGQGARGVDRRFVWARHRQEGGAARRWAASAMASMILV